MKNLILLSAVLFIGTGCSWFKSASVQAALQNLAAGGCAAETNAIKSSSQKIAEVLQCANVAAIQDDVTRFVGNLNICKLVAPKGVQAQGPVANLICPVAAAAAVGFATQAVPAGWGCTVSVAADKVQQALIAACELAPI